MNAFLTDTITAIATPPGRGGVGVIRISGPDSLTIAKTILKKTPKHRYAHIGSFYDENDQVIDQGIALFFENPKSFTGEDVVELQAHGGPVILDCLLKRILRLGARIAEPGEFSKRAFLNHKIDLAQAESIADLIDASSEQAARLAVHSLQGEFSKRIQTLVDLIIELRKYIEASIDFSEEEIDFLGDDKVKQQLDTILKQLESTEKSTQQGVIFQEGMTVVIAGEPNVGKSTLLNCLTGRDSAIVTEIAGTTRDVLREYIQIDGMPLHVIDTAGLRESGDIVEQEGVRRAKAEMEKADLVLHMAESADNQTAPVLIINKIDLTNEKPRIEKQNDQTIIYLSAKEQVGIDLLEQYLKEFMGFDGNTEGVFLARRRHLDAIIRAKENVLSAQKQLNDKAGELLAEDLHLAQNALSEIVGEFTPDDLLDKIFSTFCVGK